MNYAKRIIRYATVAMLTVSAAVAAPTVVQADPGDGWLSIQNLNSGLFLAVAGSSDANSAAVIQYYELNQPDGQPIPDQDWLLVDRGNGWLSWRNAGTPDRKALAVAAHSTANSAKIIQYTYQPSNTDQQWALVEVADRLYQL